MVRSGVGVGLFRGNGECCEYVRVAVVCVGANIEMHRNAVARAHVGQNGCSRRVVTRATLCRQGASELLSGNRLYDRSCSTKLSQRDRRYGERRSGG
jgi:hypothetical protein